MCLWSPSMVLKDMLQPFMRHLFGRSWRNGSKEYNAFLHTHDVRIYVYVVVFKWEQ